MVRDRRGVAWLGRLFALAVIVLLFWGVAYPYFIAPKVPASYTPPTAERGDFAEVDYRGWFADPGFPDSLKTFDTSIESIAKDNATYLKAASFSYRTGGARYSVFQFTVGCTGGPSCPIGPFQDAILGLRPGESRVVVIPPEKAYGLSDPSRIHVRPLLEDVTATESMNASEFQARFGSRAVDGVVVVDPDWGWNVSVRVSGDIVTARHSPTLHQELRVGGRWDAEVVSIDDGANGGLGTIQVRHRLIAPDVYGFVAADRTGNFIVVAIDFAAGTYTADYNNEVVGKRLGFDITLRTLRKGSP